MIEKLKSGISIRDNRVVSFDLHDTLLVFGLGGKLIKKRFFYIIFRFLSNFRLFIFIYTFFCKRNEPVIELMKQSKAEGNKIIILTYTHKKCAKIIHYFLEKNKIINYDQVIFRQNFWQKEEGYKIEQIIKNNISSHHDDNQEVCSAINAQGIARALLAV